MTVYRTRAHAVSHAIDPSEQHQLKTERVKATGRRRWIGVELEGGLLPHSRTSIWTLGGKCLGSISLAGAKREVCRTFTSTTSDPRPWHVLRSTKANYFRLSSAQVGKVGNVSELRGMAKAHARRCQFVKRGICESQKLPGQGGVVESATPSAPAVGSAANSRAPRALRGGRPAACQY